MCLAVREVGAPLRRPHSPSPLQSLDLAPSQGSLGQARPDFRRGPFPSPAGGLLPRQDSAQSVLRLTCQVTLFPGTPATAWAHSCPRFQACLLLYTQVPPDNHQGQAPPPHGGDAVLALPLFIADTTPPPPLSQTLMHPCLGNLLHEQPQPQGESQALTLLPMGVASHRQVPPSLQAWSGQVPLPGRAWPAPEARTGSVGQHQGPWPVAVRVLP